MTRVVDMPEYREILRRAREEPVTDWFATQRVADAYLVGGERLAGSVLGAVPPEQRPRVLDLCHVMYRACELKRLPREAFAYNALAGAWNQVMEQIPEELR